MKKLLPFLIFLAFANTSKATLTFTLVTPVCDSNGVLVVQYSGFMLPPFNIQWSYGGNWVTHTVHGFSDTIHNYNGAPFTYVYWYDSSYTTYDTGSFIGTPPLTFTLSSTTAVCPAMPTVNAVVTSGTGPFTYKWFNYTSGGLVGTTSSLVVPSGMYSIWITNGSGCGSGTATTGQWDSAFAAVTFTDALTSTSANCTNGTAAMTSISGSFTRPLSFLWSNGATDSAISGLSMGAYTLTVSDSAGCSYTAYAYIDQLTSIPVYTTPSPATCIASDGAIIGFGSGGMPPYSYLWSNGATTQSQTGLPSGGYNLTVTDANGCIGSGSGYITASTPITVTYSAIASSCTAPTGSASLYITGGTLPYHDTFYTSPMQTGSIATSLAPNTYNFHVVDAMGCVQNGSVVVPPVDNLIFGFTQTPATCTLSNGSCNVYVSGGVLPLTYAWSTGSTISSINSQPAGWYAVTVTDANGCAKTKYGEILDYSPLSLGLSSTPATCIFTSNGTASASPYGGTAPYTYSWSNGGTTATISGLPTNPYWVYVTDHMGCTAYDYDYVGYNVYDSSCFCTIKGTVYHDANVNCTREAGEAGIPNVQVECSGIGYTYTDDSGNYSFIVPTGTYTISEAIQVFYPLSGCQPNNIPVTVAAATGCVHTVDFANIYDTLHDMQISTWDYNYPVPGNSYRQINIVHNGGSITEANPVAGKKTDPQLYGATFTPSGVYGGGFSTSYDYHTAYTGGLGSLTPGASQSFYVDYNVPTFIPIGTPLVFEDTVAYIAPLDSWITDYAPWDNVNYYVTPVRSSYDPNFKEVTPRGYGANGVITTADSNLKFMVHFQNTGTAPAQNIVIIDTLDANLDWTSLRPVFETAPCKITQSVTGKVVKFTFKNINLPAASTDPVNSNGMLTYNIKMRHGLTIGTQIKNSASIYFDYNTPIKTNTTLNTIGWPVAVDITTKAEDFFSIYPNPAGTNFNATINCDIATNNAQLVVSDITGKVLIMKSLGLVQGTQTVSVDVNKLSAGIYLVTVNEGGKMQTKKLVVMK